MEIFICILICIVCTLLTMQLYYRSKYVNYFEIATAAEKHVDQLKSNTTNYIVKERKKIRKELNEKYAKAIDKFRTELEQEYNEACEEVKSELFSKLEEIDTAIGEHNKELSLRNILTFSCSCSRDLIPVAIDFSKENTFVCNKCGSKYKIAINANPVLIGRGVSDEEFANLLEKRLNEN